MRSSSLSVVFVSRLLIHLVLYQAGTSYRPQKWPVTDDMCVDFVVAVMSESSGRVSQFGFICMVIRYSERCLKRCTTSTSHIYLPLYDELLVVFLMCKLLWIKAYAK